uniref:Putative secreted protein n=1 Tax=Ixodes ricinus TaxID=34613 RepID=A0A6B0TXX8_IXORI
MPMTQALFCIFPLSLSVFTLAVHFRKNRLYKNKVRRVCQISRRGMQEFCSATLFRHSFQSKMCLQRLPLVEDCCFDGTC